jgi:hypothetical protein
MNFDELTNGQSSTRQKATANSGPMRSYCSPRNVTVAKVERAFVAHCESCPIGREYRMGVSNGTTGVGCNQAKTGGRPAGQPLMVFASVVGMQSGIKQVQPLTWTIELVCNHRCKWPPIGHQSWCGEFRHRTQGTLSFLCVDRPLTDRTFAFRPLRRTGSSPVGASRPNLCPPQAIASRRDAPRL